MSRTTTLKAINFAGWVLIGFGIGYILTLHMIAPLAVWLVQIVKLGGL